MPEFQFYLQLETRFFINVETVNKITTHKLFQKIGIYSITENSST